MRIALFFPGCHRRGGIERVVLECANFLARRGHDVHLFASEWDAELVHPGIVCHQVRAVSRISIFAMLGFAFFSRRALAAMSPAPEVVGVFGVQCPPGGVLWVPSVHRAWLNISQQRRGFTARLKQRCNPFHAVVLAFERLCFGGRKYLKLLAHTEDVRSDLMSIYGVPTEDADILPNGYSEAEFNIEAREANRACVREELGYAELDRVVIFVANELERKGFGPLLRAAAALEDPRVKMLAVGRLDPAPYRDEIKRLGMSGRVHFTGASDKVARFYAAADVFALPTQYEAWGLVIIEAMACGLPALTSRLAGAAIAIREGETGRLVDDPDDAREIAAALRPLLNGEHASAKDISASVADYKWSRIFIRYEQALAGCARRNPAAVPSVAPAEVPARGA
jgi:UDP-glucose:(heptosyl)LPS alpha-1,3-glucosyltransferase